MELEREVGDLFNLNSNLEGIEALICGYPDWEWDLNNSEETYLK